MEPFAYQHQVEVKPTNKFDDIVNAMRKGRTIGIVDLQGTVHWSYVQGIRKEGGTNIWLVQTLDQQICCLAV